ncbi:uncharacterized protein [Clytia hemisphaerica]|uniref:Uncharacterized protein n=1 Tax=Clytia hemisphaerica TaxID=252671 RepID=A0A7M5U115_9CNID
MEDNSVPDNATLLQMFETMKSEMSKLKQNNSQQRINLSPPASDNDLEDFDYDYDDVELYASQDEIDLIDPVEENGGEEEEVEYESTEQPSSLTVATATDAATASTSPKNKNDEIGEDIFSEIKVTNSSDSQGEKISESWAKIINDSFHGRKEKDDIKKLREMFPTPKNCTLPTPKLNIEIWQLLNAFQKRSDVSLKMIQRNIIAGTSGIIELVQDVLNNKADKKQLVQKSTDIIGLLGHASNEISLKRKQYIKTALKDEYKDLVSITNQEDSKSKSSEKLFGENLSECIKDLKLRNKLKGPTTSTRGKHRGGYSGRFQPYNKDNSSFLGYGRRGMSSSTQSSQPKQRFYKKKGN